MSKHSKPLVIDRRQVFLSEEEKATLQKSAVDIRAFVEKRTAALAKVKDLSALFEKAIELLDSVDLAQDPGEDAETLYWIADALDLIARISDLCQYSCPECGEDLALRCPDCQRDVIFGKDLIKPYETVDR